VAIRLASNEESKVLDVLEKVSKSVVNISTIRLIQDIFYQVFPVKGMGETTVSIFLRELRDVWDKAKPNPTSLVVMAATNLRIVDEKSPKGVLRQLEEFWAENAVEGMSFINFETALLRLGKNYCRKEKCAICPVKTDCKRHVMGA
jgi:hypothetical protein